MKTRLKYIMTAVAVILSGCGTSTSKRQYVIDISPPHSTKISQPPTTILEVSPFTIDAKFSGRQMVYRIDEFRYVSDYHNEFFIPPAQMITESARNWLADTGLFAYVTEPGSNLTPTCVLQGSIIACYADIRDKVAPVAVLEIRVFLTKYDKGVETFVWYHTYDAKEPMNNTNAASFAAAISRCLQTVMEKLRENLQAKLL